MSKLNIKSTINFIIFLYIFSLCLFDGIEGKTVICNIAALLLMLLIWIDKIIRKKPIFISRALFPIFLFIIICIFSCYGSINNQVALEKVNTLVLLFILMLSLINYIDELSIVYKIMNYFVFSSVFMSFAIFMYSNFKAHERYGAQFGNVNTVGMILSLSAVFCTYRFFCERNKLFLLPLLPIMSAMLLTGSRKALLFYVINVFIFLLLHGKKDFKKVIKPMGFILGAIFIAFIIIYKNPVLFNSIGKRLVNLIAFILGKGTREGSINERFYMLKLGIEMFRKNFLSGFGIDNYRFLLKAAIGVNTYSHNNFVELAVGTGVFGLCCYYMAHILLLKYLLEGSRNRALADVCYLFIAIILGYFILSWSLVYYDSKWFAILFSLGICCYRLAGRRLNYKNINTNLKDLRECN